MRDDRLRVFGKEGFCVYITVWSLLNLSGILCEAPKIFGPFSFET